MAPVDFEIDGEIAQISAGPGYPEGSVLALLTNGTVLAWGVNTYGQLGDNTTDSRSTPTRVLGLENVAAVAASKFSMFSLALLEDGRVFAWGRNNEGQLGDGTKIDRYVPMEVTGIPKITAISAGDEHSLALGEDGFIYGWGRGIGRLCDGETFGSSTPVSSTFGTVVSISAGLDHSVAILADGRVMTCGGNEYGQLGITADFFTDKTPVEVPGLSTAVAGAAGSHYSLVLLADGRIMSFGRNGDSTWGPQGVLGANITGLLRDTPEPVFGIDSAVAVTAGVWTSYAQLEDGRLVTWGEINGKKSANAFLPREIIGIEDLVSISASSYTYAVSGGDLACSVTPGYTGTWPDCDCITPGWFGCGWDKGWLPATAVPCPEGYTDTFPNCECDTAYQGCAWMNTYWESPIGPVACPATASYSGTTPDCTCSIGYYACRWGTGGWSTGTVRHCPSSLYEGTSPDCTCQRGAAGCGWDPDRLLWKAAYRLGCPSVGYVTSNCQCQPKFVGCDWNYTTSSWTEAQPIPCPDIGYTDSPPECECAPGYLNCSWLGSSWNTILSFTPCPDTGYSEDCECEAGYVGCAWNATSVEWHTPHVVPCPSVGYIGESPACVCDTGYSGCGWNGTAWTAAVVVASSTTSTTTTPSTTGSTGSTSSTSSTTTGGAAETDSGASAVGDSSAEGSSLSVGATAALGASAFVVLCAACTCAVGVILMRRGSKAKDSPDVEFQDSLAMDF